MMKINSLILGVGETGVRAVNRIKSALPDFRTVTLSDEVSARISLADDVLTSKYEFADSQKFFPTPNTAVFVVTDAANVFDVSLACEIGAVTARRGAFAAAVAFVPSSLDDKFDDSVRALGELHETFSGVIRFNEGYVESFFDEAESFFKVLSRAMSASAAVRRLRECSPRTRTYISPRTAAANTPTVMCSTQNAFVCAFAHRCVSTRQISSRIFTRAAAI